MVSLNNLGARIAVGNTAEVYDFQPGWVLKLFKDNYTRGAVEYEFNINRAVENAGIPVPKTGEEIVELDGRFGILYEKVVGLPMSEALGKQPWKVAAFGRKLAELHAIMHSEPSAAEGIPSAKDRTRGKIEHAVGLSEKVKEAALQALEAMPTGDRICHGDFHPENILLDGNQSYILDWVDAFIGSPLADVARTSVILMGAAATMPAKVPALFVRMIHKAYLKHYFHLRPGGEEECERWKPIIAAGRLSEGGLDYQRDWLVEQAMDVLK